MNKILPVILAGGTGSRLWPLSRELYPKQYLNLVNNLSMLQQTVTRLSGIEHQDPIVICNEEHRFIAAEQIRSTGNSHSGIILEPVGRNTAPAITLAALQASKTNSDTILLVLAADHLIDDIAEFERTILKGILHAKNGELVTFGVIPNSPEVGYGYIKRGERKDVTNQVFQVECFVEKPDLSTAKSYLLSGDYYWNSGMFMFKSSQYLAELELYNPEILSICNKAFNDAKKDMDFIRVEKSSFENCPNLSIDYALMEKTRHATVIPIDVGWCDVGSWSALWNISEKDNNGNVVKGDVLAIDSKNNYIRANNRLVATVGLNDCVVVEAEDAVLVANRSQVQDVKKIVDYLKRNERIEYKSRSQEYRPWGVSETISSNGKDKVKRIVVKQGQKIKKQKHQHRVEHWVVVSGRAKITKNSEVFILTKNQSTYIPLGVTHSLENSGDCPLEIIEIQTGSCMNEEDITRYE